MRRFGLSCLAVLFVLTSAQFASAKGAKSAKVAKTKGPAPIAKDSDVKELKGEFTWGMSPQQLSTACNLKCSPTGTCWTRKPS